MGANITIQTHMLGDQRVGYIVDPKTFGDEDTINEAIDLGYVVGKRELVTSQLRAVLKSMIDGLSKDGSGRRIDKYLSVKAFANGRLDDICDDLDLSKIGVRAVAQALKELTIDTSDWTITIEGGADTLVIRSITTGEATGQIVVGEDVNINGDDLVMEANDTITWAVVGTEKSGTIAAAKRTSDVSRITIAGDALSELSAPEYDGKTIVFTVTIGNRKATKSATLCVED